MVLPLKSLSPFTSCAKPASSAAVEISNSVALVFLSYHWVSVVVPSQTSEVGSSCAVICKDKKGKEEKGKNLFH